MISAKCVPVFYRFSHVGNTGLPYKQTTLKTTQSIQPKKHLSKLKSNVNKLITLSLVLNNLPPIIVEFLPSADDRNSNYLQEKILDNRQLIPSDSAQLPLVVESDCNRNALWKRDNNVSTTYCRFLINKDH